MRLRVSSVGAPSQYACTEKSFGAIGTFDCQSAMVFALASPVALMGSAPTLRVPVISASAGMQDSLHSNHATLAFKSSGPAATMGSGFNGEKKTPSLSY